MKTLQVIASAYRCNIEEQDDPILWITHTMKGAGATLGVLFRGNAVNYAVKGQNAEGISFGSWKQSQPPRIEHDVKALIDKGIDVHLVAEDATDRGIQASDLLPGIKQVERAGIPMLFEQYDRIWHW